MTFGGLDAGNRDKHPEADEQCALADEVSEYALMARAEREAYGHLSPPPRDGAGHQPNNPIAIRSRAPRAHAPDAHAGGHQAGRRQYLQQQARFDAFMQCFNHERPHQALAMQVPGDLYARSPRPYAGLVTLAYPLHDWTGTVTHCGRICYKSRTVNLSQVFAGQDVGVKQVDDHSWLVTFMDCDLGDFDDETCRLEPIANPFGPKVLPMSPAE